MLPPEYVHRHATTTCPSRDGTRLALLVLEGGEAFLVRARDALARGDVPAFVADVARAQDVVTEIVERADARATGVATALAQVRELMVRRLARGDGRGVD